ncbi:MAG: hypothetical protein V1725_03015 [archaeon]
MQLIEWTTRFIKFKDAMERKLQSMKEENNKIICQFKDKTLTYVCGQLADFVPEDAIFVCENTPENLDVLIKKWDAYTQCRKLMIIFVNLARNEKWSIIPYTHSLIAERESLEQGLRTLFDNCNGAVEKIPKAKKKMFEEPEDTEN